MRFPDQHPRSSLQAWDSADEYLLQYLSDELDANRLAPADFSQMAIVNDDFGALACALSEHHPIVYTDSHMSELAIYANAQRNKLGEIKVRNVLSLNEAPDQKLSLLIIKLPRSMSMLEQALILLRPLIDENTSIIACAKVKAITSNVLKLFEKLIGETKTSLAKKKSRLIFSKLSVSEEQALANANSFPTQVKDETLPFTLFNHANVFCREHLDIGARLLLKNMPNGTFSHCIDLGCGNGVLGTAFALANPHTKVSFVDESYMAVESAKLTAQTALLDQAAHAEQELDFTVSHCLSSLVEANDEHRWQEPDLVLCNPPFHQQNVILDDIACQMFVDAHEVLTTKGELRVVANRHLDYFHKLKRLFGHCELIASNRKFVVLRAVKL
ncbi:methyltransferase [Ningiella sp. W23]|uniref:methyltransferase n=1 Tax=Ningiella sp. W23 TaxID=3023715 RepID=UPI0037570AA8